MSELNNYSTILGLEYPVSRYPPGIQKIYTYQER
jgi:hypothetical protein